MTLFIAVHKWKPEEEIAVMKEIVAFFTAGKPPEGVELCAIYDTGAQGAYCVWHAPSKEDLEKLFDRYAPILKKGTEFVPVVQSYPPTMEALLGLYQNIIEMASK